MLPTKNGDEGLRAACRRARRRQVFGRACAPRRVPFGRGNGRGRGDGRGRGRGRRVFVRVTAWFRVGFRWAATAASVVGRHAPVFPGSVDLGFAPKVVTDDHQV